MKQTAAMAMIALLLCNVSNALAGVTVSEGRRDGASNDVPVASAEQDRSGAEIEMPEVKPT